MTTIATWNVNSIRTRLPHLTAWVKERSPDIILLQELKCMDDVFPREAIEDLGYNIAVRGQKAYNGVAILSKTPIEDIVYTLPTFEQDQEARYIEAVVGGIRVASVYVPNGQEVGSEKFAYKLTFLEALRTHCQTLLMHDEAVILGGDYNIAPFLADAHTAEAFAKERLLCSKEERQAFHRLMTLGYVDGFRLLYPDILPQNQRLFSWWDYRTGAYGENKGYRIDHLLCSPQAADLVKAAGIDQETRGEQQPSDHAPVWIQLT
jgi:exodeoxyribonuclease-3